MAVMPLPPMSPSDAKAIDEWCAKAFKTACERIAKAAKSLGSCRDPKAPDTPKSQLEKPRNPG